MNSSNRNWAGIAAVVAVGFAVTYFRTSTTAAQAPAAALDVAALVGRSVATQVVTLKAQNQRGEPRTITARARFDRPVQAYWVAVVGSDIQFERTAEKQLNRQLFSVDPFAKIINGNELEISGKFGIRDGSGDWDDPYEGTVTVAVTAILSGR